MQAVHNLYINKVAFEEIHHEVTRELSAIGRAFFTVKSADTAPEVGQLVIYDFGYKGATLARFFVGFIQSVTPQGQGVYAFKARELTGLLLSNVRLVLRHVTMEAVVASLGQKTGLKFVHSKAAYWKTETPYFYSIGTGRDAINNIKDVFLIDELCWQQQADGSIFIGLVSELPASSQKFNLDFSVSESLGTDGAWQVPMVAGMLPGAIISGFQINSITIDSNKMLLKCITQ